MSHRKILYFAYCANMLSNRMECCVHKSVKRKETAKLEVIPNIEIENFSILGKAAIQVLFPLFCRDSKLFPEYKLLLYKVVVAAAIQALFPLFCRDSKLSPEYKLLLYKVVVAAAIQVLFPAVLQGL
uniref:Uncharacterized protein n=1 Tax=Rhodnius prolixus TaxID=13249 RepID=T1HW05_RHOPR